MDPIVPDSTAHHVDDVVGLRGFDVRRAPVGKDTGHDSNRAAINQGFPDVTVIKHDGSVYGWDTRLVATYPNPSVNAA